jgi:MFS family permease
VPLGDGRERRGLMMTTALAASAMLLLVAVAPNLPLLAASSVLLGFASCLPQLAVPFAVGLVPPAEALRSRINAVYMVSYFLGGALGTVTAAVVWARLGWTGVSVLGAVFAGVGLLPLLGPRGNAVTAT